MTNEQVWDETSMRALATFQDTVVESFKEGDAGPKDIGVAMCMSLELFLDNVLGGSPSEKEIARRVLRTKQLVEGARERKQTQRN